MQITEKNTYRVLGIMSGSSLDGVDLALCEFNNENNCWDYQIMVAETIPYSAYWISALTSAATISGKKLVDLHIKYGQYLGEMAHNFLLKHHFTTEIIASHGHTIFHEPKLGFTFQLGEGQAIAQQGKQVIVSDFRSKDITLGGQGAPLVPIGDEYLFGDFKSCINIGGIANISFKKNGKRIAFDICPANQLLNYLSEKLGKPYDDKGKIAASGSINKELLLKLNSDDFYSINPPKSLSNQYVQENFISAIDDCDDKIENKLRTVNEHVSIQLLKAIENSQPGKVMITGGGAYNSFLISKIYGHSSNEIIVPEDILVDFKEAMIFAFMGVLRIRDEINCLASVSGAKKDSSGGVIFYP